MSMLMDSQVPTTALVPAETTISSPVPFNAARRQAQRLHLLHTGTVPLILPNAWDAGSARMIEAWGANAIATSSAAMAWSHGLPDGERLSRAELMASVRRMAGVLSVPLTVDIESGYADGPHALDEVETLVAALLEAGVAGINIEDGRAPVASLVARIAAARRAANAAGVPLFINARTDIYLRSLVPPELRLDETLLRARMVAEAGADGLFVPGLLPHQDIRTLATRQLLPLNLMLQPGLPPIARLRELGVRRISTGMALFQKGFAAVRNSTLDLLRGSDSPSLFNGQLSFGEIEQIMQPRPASLVRPAMDMTLVDIPSVVEII